MTADTYSSTLGYLVQGTGNNNNTWGTNANSAVFQIFEDAIANVLTSTVTGGTLDLSGTPPPAAASQTRYGLLLFTGTLLSNQIVKVPNLVKTWLVANATSGAFTLTIKTPSGSASTAIPQNSNWQVVLCNGANGITVFPFNNATIQMPDGGLTAPAYSNINEPTSGWYRAGTQDWRLAINGAAVLQVTGTGAGSPSIVNVLSPNALQIAGVAVSATAQVPAGAEIDFAGVVTPTGYLPCEGSAYSRATYATLFAAITYATLGSTHSSTSITGLAVDLRNVGLEGAYVEGTGITTGTTVVSVTGASTLTLSQAATGTASNITLRFIPHGQGDGSTTFNVPDRRGRTVACRDNWGGSTAGRMSGAFATKINGTGGAESVAILQGNLPIVDLAVTFGTIATSTTVSSVTVNKAVTGLTGTVTAGGGYASVQSGAGSTALNNNGATLGLSFTEPNAGLGHEHTATALATSGTTIGASTAALGGSASNLSIVQPTGMANRIIKT